MRRWIFYRLAVLCTLLSTGISHGQNTVLDSLFLQLGNAKGPKEKTNALFAIGQHFEYTQTDSAIRYLSEAEQLAQTHALSSELLQVMMSLGRANYVKGDYLKALKTYQDALKLAEGMPGNGLQVAKLLNSVGVVLHMFKEDTQAMQLHRRSQRMSLSLGDSVLTARNFLNMSILHRDNHRYDSAEYYIRSAEGTLPASGNQLRSLITAWKGEIQYDMGDYEAARRTFEQGLALPALNNWDKGFILSGLARYFLQKGDWHQAAQYAQNSIEIGLAVNSFWDLQRAYEVMAEAQAKLGDFPAAYSNSLLFKAYSDSLFNLEKQREINYLLFKEAEMQSGLLAKANQSQTKIIRLQYGLLGVGLVALLGISWLSFSLARKRAKLKTALAQLYMSKQAVEMQYEELERMNLAKVKLFSIISHDMRGPIGNLRSMLMLWENAQLSADEQLELSQHLSIALLSVEEMLTNLLEWAKAQLNGIRPNPRRISVGPIVEKQIYFWQPTAQKKGIRLQHFQPIRTEALADPDMLPIVFRNLIGNALKFTPKGGGISIDYLFEENRLLIKVSDTGRGIHASKLEQLFHTFGRELNELGTESEIGTGIGLKLCHDLITANQGTIIVESQLGKGSSFTVVLPAPH